MGKKILICTLLVLCFASFSAATDITAIGHPSVIEVNQTYVHIVFWDGTTNQHLYLALNGSQIQDYFMRLLYDARYEAVTTYSSSDENSSSYYGKIKLKVTYDSNVNASYGNAHQLLMVKDCCCINHDCDQ